MKNLKNIENKIFSKKCRVADLAIRGLQTVNPFKKQRYASIILKLQEEIATLEVMV